MTQDVLDYFPRGFTPRDIQVEALRRVDAAYRNGAKYVVLEAPPGTGKSHIAMTLAAAYGRTYINTLTEQLQTQYVNVFSGFDIKPLKGRAKFMCSLPEAKINCQLGKAFDCAERVCPYLQAKRIAFDAEVTVSNYHSIVANAWQADRYESERLGFEDVVSGIGRRSFMVCDEAHAIENFLLDHVGFTVDRKKLSDLFIETADLPVGELFDVMPYVEWIRTTIPAVLYRLGLTRELEAKDKLQILVQKMELVVEEATERPNEFILERELERGRFNKDKFALKPLRVARYGRLIFRHAKRLLLMSATVLDNETLVRNIGLEPADGAFVQMDSVFPVANRPIKVCPMDLTMAARPEVWPVVVELVEDILDEHHDQKGLLLCPSNEMLQFIHQRLSSKNAARLIFAFGETRAKQYELHLSSDKPTVLAASGYWEGADLKDDASRFQIIPAVPRARWKGQIKARAQLEPAWYRWLSYTKIVQGYGRSVRSETDSATTYIFDAQFLEEMRRRDSMLPPWVQAAVTVEGGN